MATATNNASVISAWASNATVLGSDDSYLLLNIFPNDASDKLFSELRDEIT